MIFGRILDKRLWWVLAGAFILRVIGIGFGLYHPDEHLIVNHALAFGTGDPNPHMFYFPTFFLYLLFFVYGIFYTLGHLCGVFPNTESFLTFYLLKPHIFYVLARLVSALFGTLTIGAVYALGKEYKNSRTGWYSALLLAVSFLHVRDSHFGTMDIFLTFLTTLSLWPLMRFADTRETRHYFLSIAIGGVAAAVKYNAFLLAVPIGLAYFFTRFIPAAKKSVFKALGALLWEGLLSAALFLFSFFVCSPFVFLDHQTAAGYIHRLYGINRHFDVNWSQHAFFLFYGLGAASFAIAVLGFFKEMLHFQKKTVVFLSFVLLYYAMITKAGQPFERYGLVLVPLLLVLAASFLDGLKDPRTGKILVATLLLLSLPKVFFSDALFLKQDTRDMAKEWIARHVPSEKKIALDNPGWCPRLVASRRQMMEKIEARRGHPQDSAKAMRLKHLASLDPYPTPNYDLYYLKQEPEAESPYTMLGPFLGYDAQVVHNEGIDYIVTSDLAMRRNADFYKSMERDLELVATFDPRRGLRLNLSKLGWTYMPIDNSLWAYSRPGPLVTIYGVKKK